MSDEVSLKEYAEEFLALTTSAIKVRQKMHQDEIQLAEHPTFEKMKRLIDVAQKDNYKTQIEALNFPQVKIPLIEATKATDVGLVKFLVYHGASPFAESLLTHESPFFVAANVDSPPLSRAIIEFFISRGVNRENIDEALTSAGHHLPTNHPNISTLSLFIELQQYIYNNLTDNNHHGLDENIIDIRKHTSQSLKDSELDLYIASILSASFSHKLEHEKYKRLSPLNAALQSNNFGMVETLIRNGANILKEDESAKMPIRELLKVLDQTKLCSMLSIATSHHLFSKYLSNPVSLEIFDEIRNNSDNEAVRNILDASYNKIMHHDNHKPVIEQEYKPKAIAISSRILGKFTEMMYKKEE